MNKPLPSEPPHRRQGKLVWLVLALLPLMLVVVLLAWALLRGSAGSVTTVFGEPPGAVESTTQPLSAQNLSHLHTVWTYRYGPTMPGRMVVANGTVYTAAPELASNAVVAVQDGKQLWRYQTPGSDAGDLVIGAIQVGGDVVYVATYRVIHALNASTGQEIWQYHAETGIHLSGARNDLVYADATLYFTTSEQVCALDARTGQMQWTYRYTSDSASGYIPFPQTLVVASGSVYLSLITNSYAPQASLIALDSRTGTERWRLRDAATKAFMLLPSPIVTENGILYRATDRGIFALDTSTGNELWHLAAHLPQGSRTFSMSEDGHLLYVIGMNGTGLLQTFDLSTGHPAWSTQVNGTTVTIGPTVSNGVLYVATFTPFTSYSRSLFGPPPSTPHWMYALDASSGRIVRMLQDYDPTFEPDVLAADDTHLYVAGSRSFVGGDNDANGEPDLYVLGV